MKRILTVTVLLLSFVSLFTDVASEMLYPVIPMYLVSINYTAAFIGVLEGVAEFIAGLSKGYFGILSDKIQRRLPFVRSGYLISAISKPLMIVIPSAWWILLTRTMDRFGKGVRTASRDAMLSAESTPETKGRVFGFHRSMDTVGAAIGPAIALAFLYFYPGQYKWLFIFALLPGLATIAFLWKLKEPKNQPAKNNNKVSFLSFFNYVKHSPKAYRYLIAGLLFFALFNSSDMFLLLKAKELHYSDAQVIGLYIFYNLVYALLSYPAGMLADKFGLNKIYVFGILVFAGVYAGFAFTSSFIILMALFFTYGFYSAATEGISKAWITNLVSKEETASAIGSFTAFQSITSLFASVIAGILWAKFGAMVAFSVTAAMSLLVVMYMLIANKKIAVQR